jgi:hypothetical protein
MSTQQAILWPGPTSSSSGFISLHFGLAYSQRGSNGQHLGHSSKLGGNPSMVDKASSERSSNLGRDFNNAKV